jgi:hypothetical protein
MFFQTVYLYTSYNSQNKQRLFSLNVIDWLVFVMNKLRVFCEVRTYF